MPFAYVLDATQADGGGISPETAPANPGDNVTFTITADASHTIESLIIDGVTVAAAKTYTFANVQASHTITAVFRMVDWVNGICDALVATLKTLNDAVDFTVAGSLVERNPGPIDWKNCPKPYACVGYMGTGDNGIVTGGQYYRATGDFSVRFLLVPVGGVIDKALGERYAARVMQDIIRHIMADPRLGGALDSGLIWAKDSKAGEDPEVGNLLCGGEVTFGATWEWTP